MSANVGAKPLRGFAHVDHYWDPTIGQNVAKIMPGQFYVTRQDEVVVTVLGSCISACVRDPVAEIGGMNHFMLPGERRHEPDNDKRCEAARYGGFAMESLINEILKFGGDKRRLEIKVFGGGRMLAGMTDIGDRNIRFVHEFLREERLSIASEDVGENFPRKIYYFPRTGRVRLKKLDPLHNDTILRRESAYITDLERKPIAGDVEIF